MHKSLFPLNRPSNSSNPDQRQRRKLETAYHMMIYSDYVESSLLQVQF